MAPLTIDSSYGHNKYLFAVENVAGKENTFYFSLIIFTFPSAACRSGKNWTLLTYRQSKVTTYKKLSVFVPILSKLVFFTFPFVVLQLATTPVIFEIKFWENCFKYQMFNICITWLRTLFFPKIMKLISKMWILIFDDLLENFYPQRISQLFERGEFSTLISWIKNEKN